METNIVRVRQLTGLPISNVVLFQLHILSSINLNLSQINSTKTKMTMVPTITCHSTQNLKPVVPHEVDLILCQIYQKAWSQPSTACGKSNS